MANVQNAHALDVLWRPAPSGELMDLGRLYRAPLALARLHSTPKRILSRRETLLLGAFVLALHGAVIYAVDQHSPDPLAVLPPEIPPMTIEFSRPAPPVVEAPPPEPPVQPVVAEPPPPAIDEMAAKPTPPKPVVKAKPAVKPVPRSVAKTAEPPPAPAVAPQPIAAPAPPAPTAPKPVTPASASAGYLKNPAPEYPPLAMRRGWEGTVLLRVQVLASGKPGEIQIQKSSGRDQLDDAALAAVKRWSFVPAKQGDVAQEGWVSVPIDFKIR